MRCLALAQHLTMLGHRCTFYVAATEGNLAEWIQSQGIPLVLLPQSPAPISSNPANEAWLSCSLEQEIARFQKALGQHRLDWLVLDHYGLDKTWIEATRSLYRHILAIDDLADRSLPCDGVLNPSASSDDYQSLLKPSTAKLLGGEFALLRSEFSQYRELSLTRPRQQLQRLLLNLGGADNDNLTLALAEILEHALPPQIRLDILTGPTYRHGASLAPLLARKSNWCHWHAQASVAPLLCDIDLAIGAAGSSAWERCCLGIPSLMMIQADNQIAICHYLEAAGAAMIFSPPTLETQLSKAVQILPSMASQAATLVDGRGCARVSQWMEQRHAI
ncbi:UDP-2,4-diacetamido-2,4,6-trideoxy-beta-L-altropyranose hydrolase [Gallaecimonas kandeliae]|uniref:UDP-2,4-diacetamido-2,4, 6-trideoxy-beta-L-altropyranose hydrolase n=1 Tax=Gallaecimonas kandeliae TaxID=3029055 RepID=UPI002649715E|nr:UDP-2,4-diacetamido-2,4,6-trideoxy-beta-L-altropyranose hydrolase [Gallaecimonas kandeliae]WKE66730.1 UDP-2,4-diacetamido-2,4,6-trideoxy-beta-L-altropyranose hydrolase [Gallaecimonas kandeliae]